MAGPIRTTDEGQFWIDARLLEQEVFGGGEVPETEEWRRYYGRELTPQTIEAVIRSADMGFMRDLTDLEYETIKIDGHLGSSVRRRFLRISAVDWTLEPATGHGIDPARAEQRADEVRQQLDRVRNFRDALVQLDWAHCHGRAAIEKEWAFEPNESLRWRIDSLNWIHPRRLSFGPERELRLRDDIWAAAGFEPRGTDLRSVPFKWISFTPQVNNDYPEREGFGPQCLYWAFFKRFGWRERMILTEVFAKPWRIVEVDKDASAGAQQLETARNTADKLGASATGMMPKGIHLVVHQLHPDSGKTHKELCTDADDEMSKIVLGQTRTQDAKPGALGSEADRVAQDSEDLIVAADARRISACLTDNLCRDIVVLNHGPEEARYTPTFKISVEPPPNRKQEIENAKIVLVDMGLALKRSELYERIGYEEPGPDDEVVEVKASGAAPPGGGVASDEGLGEGITPLA